MTLDELAREYPCGTVIRHATGNPAVTVIARVIGVCFSLPKEVGGPDEPALVTLSATGAGNVYPDEVIERRDVGTRSSSH